MHGLRAEEEEEEGGGYTAESGHEDDAFSFANSRWLQQGGALQTKQFQRLEEWIKCEITAFLPMQFHHFQDFAWNKCDLWQADTIKQEVNLNGKIWAQNGKKELIALLYRSI